MEIKIEAKGMNYTFINAYAPHSARPANEKQMFWNKLESRCNQIQRKSPTYIIGDFNARLYGRQISEHDIMGPFIFGPGTLALSQMTPDMMENRQNIVDFCKFNGYILSGTYFEKHVSKQCTYKFATTNGFVDHGPPTDSPKLTT